MPRMLMVLLASWLTISSAFWLFGMLWAGRFMLPQVNEFTLFFIYLPWLILIGVSLKARLAKAVLRG